MKLLVTGGAGFIGSAVVRQAIVAGHQVVNLDALTYAACLDNLASVADHPGYAFEHADIRDRAALDRARDFLMKRQLPTGDWAQEGITGVFNRSCGITYTAYRNLFPMWALARYAATYEQAEK